MADTDREECLICNREMEKEHKTRIGDRAIHTLIKASKEIKDKKYLKMEGLAFMNIHKSCHTRYIRPSHIKRAKKAISDKLATTRRNNKEARKFNFSSLCLLCASDAITHTHKRPISLVSSDTFKENILEALLSRPDNDFNRQLRLRLKFATDLQKNEARYHRKCLAAFYSSTSETTFVGRPMSDDMSAVVNHVIQHMLENSEDSQFSLTEMTQSFQDNLPRINGIKQNLTKYFEKDIVMYTVPNDTIICFVDRKGKVLDKEWYQKKASTDKEERLRIVEMAAHIILQDIRGTYYDAQTYTTPSSSEDVEKDVPKSLQVFLNTLIKSNKGSENATQNKWAKRVSTIAHIVISCVRPRTFLSSVLLGLSSFIRKKFNTTGLLDTLSYLGLCASYQKSQHFESSVVKDPEQVKIFDDAFVQFSSDNVDHDTNATVGTPSNSSTVTSETSMQEISDLKRRRIE